MLVKVDDIIIGRPVEKEDDYSNSESSCPKPDAYERTLIFDATYTSQNVQFPTDASLLNEV